jgi:hypothetical protein
MSCSGTSGHILSMLSTAFNLVCGIVHVECSGTVCMQLVWQHQHSMQALCKSQALLLLSTQSSTAMNKLRQLSTLE